MTHGARPLRSTRRLSNSIGQRPGWYRITNKRRDSDGMEITQVSIYDEIGFFGVSAADFLADLRQVRGDIELHINSPGGDVFDGIAIYNTLLQARNSGTVHVIIDGLAASAASFIAMAASPGLLEIAPHAQAMIHDGFAMCIGNAADLRELADQVDQISNEIAGIYADRTGKPTEHWRGLMRAETWFTDKQAVAEGLVDKIHGQPDLVADTWDLTVYSKSPADGLAGGAQLVAMNGAPATMTVLNAGGSHAPMTGTHEHAHPAYGAQGSDGMHEHEHSHDGDADHGHSHDPDGDGDNDTTAAGDTDHDYVKPDGSPGPKAGNSATFPVLAADVDNTPWDASKAWHNGASSDDPAAFYRGICAGRKSGPPENQSSWALPYKYHPSDPPNAAGVRAALADLSKTQGLTNEDQARSKLQGLMKQINPDYDPADEIDGGLLSYLLSISLEGATK